MATSASIDKVQKLFIAFYQRPADVTGLEYWANRVDAANGDTSAVVNAFATSAEATALYPATLSTTQLVNNVYQALFGRAPDAAGLNFYANAIAAGTMTPGKLAQNILDGATGTDATIVANKLTVAKAYTAAMDTTAEILAYNGNNGNNALANAKALLTNVNALDTSVTNATNQIPAIMVNNVNNAAATITAPGTSFTFTAGQDTQTGVAAATGAIANITAIDSVAGTAATTDKLTLTTAGAYTTGTGTTASFEQLVLADGTNTITMGTAIVATATSGSYNVITGGTGYDTVATATASEKINLTTVTGIEQFNVASATTDVTFSGAALSGLVNTGGAASVVVLGNFLNNFNLTTTTAGGAVVVKGGSSSDTVTITGSLAATSTTFGGVEVVNGSSLADVVLFNGQDNTNTANTVGVTYTTNGGGDTITGSTKADSFTLGTGVDTVVATTSLVTAIDTITGFAAGTDKIKVGAAVATQAVTAQTVASADTGTLAAAITNAIAAAVTAGATNYDSVGDAVLITVSAGTAAGTYAVINAGATNSAFTAAEDIVVKLVGMTGTFTTADVIA